MPALACGIVHQEHMVAELLAEAELCLVLRLFLRAQIVQNISNNVLTGILYYQASTTFSAAGCKYQSLLSAPLLVTQARNSG